MEVLSLAGELTSCASSFVGPSRALRLTALQKRQSNLAQEWTSMAQASVALLKVRRLGRQQTKIRVFLMLPH